MLVKLCFIRYVSQTCISKIFIVFFISGIFTIIFNYRWKFGVGFRLHKWIRQFKTTTWGLILQKRSQCKTIVLLGLWSYILRIFIIYTSSHSAHNSALCIADRFQRYKLRWSYSLVFESGLHGTMVLEFTGDKKCGVGLLVVLWKIIVKEDTSHGGWNL